MGICIDHEREHPVRVWHRRRLVRDARIGAVDEQIGVNWLVKRL